MKIKSVENVIIIVNYNTNDDTFECIESLVNCHPKSDFLVVLVDNNSVVQPDPGRYKDLRVDIKFIYNENNVGFGKANNIGIKWAFDNLKFEYLLLLNNDTIVSEGAISNLILPFEKDKSIGITTGKIYYESNRNIIWYGGGNINYKRGWPIIADYNQIASQMGANNSRYVSFISGCLMMFTKESITKLNGFDEDYFMYCEDLELSIRARKMGYKLYYTSTSKIYHKVQGDKKIEEKGIRYKNPNLIFVYKNMKKNQLLTFKKHLSGIKFLQFIIFYHIELFYVSLKLVLRGRFDILKPYAYLINYSLIKRK